MAGHVAIVGAGFSGSMLAAHLLRAGAKRVSLIERQGEPGRGLAYGAADPIHLLNVRAGNMSAWPDAADHFVRWLERQGAGGSESSFAARRTFGSYVQEQLAEGRDRLEVIAASANDLTTSDDGISIALDDGRSIFAETAVLAIGNLPPPPPPGINPLVLPPGLYWGDPWQPGAADWLGPDDPVLVIGTGLTMVDMVVLLEERGFPGPILALSRRGLVPRAHAPAAPAAERRAEPPTTIASSLLRDVRARGEEIGWRSAVDELRPFTQAVWRSASAEQRRRFLRHLRPWWDVHRHRIAPQVHDRVAAMIARGQLQVAAGKLVTAEPGGGLVDVSWRPRGSRNISVFSAARIINCTGPEGDLIRSAEPLVRNLMAAGAIRAGPIGLGIDVDAQMRVLDSRGTPNPRLHAVGPLTRGALWEIVAVPDIRSQVQEVARQVMAAAVSLESDRLGDGNTEPPAPA